jgi:hypothetical protein
MPVMISIQQPASDLNGASTSAVKITRHGQSGQAVVAGWIRGFL